MDIRHMGVRHVVVACCTCVLLGACSTIPASVRAERQAAAITAYTAAAGEPVRSFRFVDLVSGQRLGEHQIVIHTWPTSAWVLSLENDCNAIPIATGFAVTSSFKRISIGVDRVLIFSSRRTEACRITQIRPVDLAGLSATWRNQNVRGDVLPLGSARD
jgi:hypothetical protein